VGLVILPLAADAVAAGTAVHRTLLRILDGQSRLADAVAACGAFAAVLPAPGALFPDVGSADVIAAVATILGAGQDRFGRLGVALAQLITTHRRANAAIFGAALAVLVFTHPVPARLHLLFRKGVGEFGR